jgi:transposase
LKALCPDLNVVWVDGAYATNIAGEAAKTASISLEVIPKEPGQKTFKVLPRRWVAERTFAWLMKYRRLRADYENTVSSSRA